MAKNNTNAYVLVSSYGGIDWHDCRTTNMFLQENGRYEIENTEDIIAENVHKELVNMKTECQGVVTRLQDIPSLDAVKDHIKNKESFTVKSDNEEYSEMEAVWNPEKSRLNQYYAYGQVSYELDYEVKNIAPENVIYIVVENFLAPFKGVPSIQRFYQEPFTELKAAMTALEKLQIHGNDYCPFGAVKELLIFDRSEITKTDWYKCNTQVINILATHPELDNEDNFKCQVNAHIEHLEKAVA